MFEIKAQDLAGRIGTLKTKSGAIETPYLFPVVDPTLKKQVVEVKDIERLGFKGIITNAYLALKCYGKAVNIHRVLGFDGVIMTDSGAYQLMQYGDIDVGNREIVEFQCSCGSDIGVPLDIPTKAEDPRDKVVYSVLETCRRLEEVLNIVEECRDTLWVAPIQGGTHLDILKLAAKRVVNIGIQGPFSIVAIGSPTTLLERFLLEKVVEMVGTVKSVLPPSIPVHLFGAGHPLIIPFVVALGVDLMDSASYILYARDGRYMTDRGTYRIEDLDYFPCSCPVCSKYTPKDLLEMDRDERTKLLALHNLYVLRLELSRVKQAIREGRLWEYLEEVSKRHPAAKRAFSKLLKFYKYIISRTPSSRGEIKSVMLMDRDSMYNPRLFSSRQRVVEMNFAKILTNKVALIPLLPKWKPLAKSKLAKELELKGFTVVGYAPIVGAVPSIISEVFPFSQFETATEFDDEVLRSSALLVQEFVEKYCERIAEMLIVVCRDVEWSSTMGSMLYRNCCVDTNVAKRILSIECGHPYS